MSDIEKILEDKEFLAFAFKDFKMLEQEWSKLSLDDLQNKLRAAKADRDRLSEVSMNDASLEDKEEMLQDLKIEIGILEKLIQAKSGGK